MGGVRVYGVGYLCQGQRLGGKFVASLCCLGSSGQPRGCIWFADPSVGVYVRNGDLAMGENKDEKDQNCGAT